MKFTLKPLTALNGFVLAGLLASAGTSAMAQETAAPATPVASSQATAPTTTRATKARTDDERKLGRNQSSKTQNKIANRQAELKSKLNITPAQNGAWTTYIAAMKFPDRQNQRFTTEQRAEFDKLTTPERIDKMSTIRTQRMTEMSTVAKQRGEATKTFYATLSPEQKKTFDAKLYKMGQREGRGYGRDHGRHGRHGRHDGYRSNRSFKG